MVLGLGLATSIGAPARPQAALRDVEDPILVTSPRGHSAPPRALVFDPDGGALYSAGLDKVVHRWGFGDGRPRLEGTIRPPIWRGYRGAIYAMALAPTADERGRRLLAIGGFGVDAPLGSILLYRVPGGPESPTGDLEGLLPSGDPNLPPDRHRGHVNTVNALAFAPDGRRLASGSYDGTVRLWDWERRRSVLTIRNGGSPVRAIAFADGGRRLVVGGADGRLRLWDLERRASIATAPAPADQFRPGDPDGAAINDLAVSPDERWVVVGRESGVLARFEAATLGDPALLPTDPRQGAVLALAFHPDSARLATVIEHRGLTDPAAMPRTECDVELRRILDGAILATLPPATDTARACAFGPDGRWLAVAGGNDQAIALTDISGPAPPPGEQRPRIVLSGQGTSLWDVGFHGEGATVAFSRARAIGDGAREIFEGFDLGDRRFVDVEAGRVRRALETYRGWSIRPVGPRVLDVLGPEGVRRFRIEVPVEEVRWWCYSFLPGGPGHEGGAVAVGTNAGVSIYRLADGRKTRGFAGHEAAVLAMAPSPDGRWLVTGSRDQTVRLWTLAGCDRVPPLGAAWREGGRGAWVADSVTPGGFADRMGLDPGDEVVEAEIAKEEITPLETFFQRARDAEPGVPLVLKVRRGGRIRRFVTTKRDSPALSLFPGVDREWVAWMPEGYYDTSIAGDRRVLGWHVNRFGDPTDYATLRPSRFFPLARYEERLRRPGALDVLIATADPTRALAEAGGAEALERPAPVPPPTVAIAAAGGIGDEVTDPTLPLAITAVAARGRGIRSVELLNGNRRQAFESFDEAAPEVELADRIVDLQPGLNQVTVRATDDGGLVGAARLPVTFREVEPPPTRRGSRLIVRSIGVETFEGEAIPPIDYAGRDAADLTDFLRHPAGRARFPIGAIDSLVVPPASATADRVVEVFADLQARVYDESERRLRPGDSVFVVLESHLLDFGESSGRRFLTTDSDRAGPDASAVPADLVAETLERLASYGCTVLLLLDAVHRPPSPEWPSRANEWVRDLAYRRGVIVLLASKEGPSRRLRSPGHGAFAQAVLESVQVRGDIRSLVDRGAPMTLDDLATAVSRRVEQLTRGGGGGAQFADLYLPETISDQLPIFEPRIPPIAEPPER